MVSAAFLQGLVLRDEMRTETANILSRPISISTKIPETKQTSMNAFASYSYTASTANIFQSFAENNSDELREEEPIMKDPTVKTIKLFKR